MTEHLIIVPIILPLAIAALLLLTGGRNRTLEAGLAIISHATLLVVAAALVLITDGRSGAGLSMIYRLGNWPAEFAIVLVADRLAALMVLLTSILGLVSAVFALSRWSRLGPYYYPLFQFLMMGLNGAFLTGDLFNLFVFFEILLAASYGLLLHGSGVKRVVPGLHYIVINLAASLLFLVGVSLIFGVTGTLNMAMLAERGGELEDGTRALLHAGAAILGVAFLVKAAAWPLGFWLPRTYAAAVPATAAMFAIMTKVGVYSVLRLGTLVFGTEAGPSAAFGAEWLFIAGGVTIVIGIIGMLAARDLGRMIGNGLLMSSGTLLAVIAFHDAQVLAGGLFYMSVSTVAAAALFLLSGMIGSEGGEVSEEPPVLEAYDPEADGLFTEDDERTVKIPAPIGILSGGFLIAALMIAGLPPLPGFIAKFAMLSPLLSAPVGPLPWAPWLLAVLVILSSLFPLIALARAGIQIWWVDEGSVPPTIRLGEVAPVTLLLVACLVLTVTVEGPFGFIQRAAAQLLDPAQYIETVIGTVARP